MKTIRSLAIIAFVLPLISGCTAVTLECLHLAGASYCHHSTCELVDSQTNRAILVEVITMVGNRHGMTDNTAEWRERMLRFSAPLRHDTNDDIISFVTTGGDRQTAGIRLGSYVWQGKLSADLQQVRWSKKRAARYIEIHDDFVAEIRSRFCASIRFQEADHLLP